MKRKNTKKFIILGIILVLILATFLYCFISDNLGIIELPENIIAINTGTTTSYLIEIPDGYLMVDTGYEKDFDTFISIIKEKGISVSKIKYLLLTHHHDDHSGYISKLLELQPSLKIIVHEKSVPFLASGNNNKDNGGGLVNPLIYGLFQLKKFITPDWTLAFPPFLIRDNDIILKENIQQLPTEVGIDALVIYTPGHTSDSISLLIDKEYLVCGDLSSNFLNWAGSKYLTIFNENVEDVYKSWENVISLGAKYIAPAHGKPFRVEKLKENLYKYKQSDLVKFF